MKNIKRDVDSRDNSIAKYAYYRVIYEASIDS